jgi:hypothetical protein
MTRPNEGHSTSAISAFIFRLGVTKLMPIDMLMALGAGMSGPRLGATLRSKVIVSCTVLYVDIRHRHWGLNRR